ncbi:hypothetical protein COU60_00840 [Candidatus Pacearchaeota archaeon CG10_big_fil_rev_8_21_14_0_10_34_76]|nr:MAG: hypothetical protein COU60_00840 [Candidatus Pacearchaeota archaeon CG10_big_fil_rev_8_21_14_0_10_34_76]
MVNITIIKLGAKGDVVRTLPVLKAIKNKYPESTITWITKENSIPILIGNKDIDNLISPHEITNFQTDIMYNFDMDEEATSIVSKIQSSKKYGFYSSGGYPAALNIGAEYYLNTLFDDSLKKENKKTYQEMIFEAAELPYHKEEPDIFLSEKDLGYSNEFIKSNNINLDNLIGIHLGASSRWPSKTWAENKVKEFIIKAKQRGYDILLFGGPDEKDRHEKLTSELKKENVSIFQNNPNNTDKEFAALVNICKKMVCSDSFSLHVSIALKKPTIGLFFCTSPYEVEGYSYLDKIISPVLYSFFPEKMDQYDEGLVNSISADEVINKL